MSIPHYTAPLPRITTEQMIEVDRLMIKKYRIELLQMMENAGRGLAILAMHRYLADEPAGQRVTVLAGKGGNGGGALAAARRLHNWGAAVTVYLTGPNASLTPVTSHQLAILRRMGVNIRDGAELVPEVEADLIIDGLIGYRIMGDPRGLAKTMIEWANAHTATPTLALDTPSGLDLSSGHPHDPTIRADATLTLALPKHGLFAAEARPLRGDLYLADISVPPALYAAPEFGISVSAQLFAQGDVLLIDRGPEVSG